MNYRRLFIPNTSVHIVIVTYERQKILINNIEILKNAFLNAKSYYNYEIVAYCILPDHLHIILKPDDVNKYPKIISAIKYNFSKNVGQLSPIHDLKTGYKNKREKGVWQRRYWEHTIKDFEDLKKHIDYIHYNPIKHAYVDNLKNWKYSSFDEFVKQNYYDTDWGNEANIQFIKNLNFE